MSHRPDLRRLFSTNLLAARGQAGLTQVELGRRCGLHRTEISRLERAGREPRLGTIVKLAAGLAIPLEVLCAGIAWNPEAQRFSLEQRRGETPSG